MNRPPASAPLPPACPPACPGCAHRRRSREESEAQKQTFLRERLAPWADRIEPLRGAADRRRLAYRDRSVLTAGWAGEAWQFGLTRRDELIPIPDCPVHTPAIRRALAALAHRLPPPERFPLRYLVPNGTQLTLVVKAHDAPIDWCGEDLTAELAAAGYQGLWLHCYPAAGVHTFSSNGWHLLWGEPRSREPDGPWYGPASFRQLIRELYLDSVEQAEGFLAPAAGDGVLDLYCGFGTTLARWRARGAAAVGVEVGDAVDLARLNAPGALLLRGSCEQRLPQLAAFAGATAGQRFAYLNPPRTGLEGPVARFIAHASGVRRAAYLSCSPGTLARDLALLEGGGLRVRRVIPYDFFPQTHHLESLALLSRE